MSKADSTFAFPVSPEIWATHHDFCGMTLRDHFAGRALGGMLASEGESSSYKPEWAAERAYLIADAMLAARSAEFGNIGADGVQS